VFIIFRLEPRGWGRGRERTQKLKQRRKNSFIWCLFVWALTQFGGGDLSGQEKTWLCCHKGPF